MGRMSNLTIRIGFGFLSLLLIAMYPTSVALAETVPEPTATATGPVAPDGPAANTYTFNTTTGLWENDHYTWDPVTHKTYPKDKRTYSYNPATGMWDTTEWIYNAASGKYEPNTSSVTQPPAGSATVGGPAQTAPASTQPASSTAGSGTPAPQAANNPSAGTTKKDTFSGFYNANISNNLISSAQSGNAFVAHNTTAGNATSGDAAAISTILNLLQSSTSIGDLDKVATFTTNIDGNVVGDLHIDPGTVASLQPAASSGVGSNIQVATATDNTIHNNVTVDAGSGNAAVSGNTTAGNATSGNANAVVNLVNLLNSAIATGQSFLGVLNINGSLNGDILLPPGSLNTLLASNSASTQGNLAVSDTTNQSIANNVTTHATSGAAAVTNNTAAGNATSGNAFTKLTILNLTGHEVVGSNSLLVFVNVLGQWVGAILDAPAGSTAAALGGGVTKNSLASDVSLTNTTNSAITNDVSVAAASGNATVDHNTTAGNARSGNASASANIANIAYSNLSLSDWFGILFINVFGTWNGSFGIDTEAGGMATPGSGVAAVAGASQAAQGPRPAVFRFTPHKAPSQPSHNTSGTPAEPHSNQDKPAAQILGTTDSGSDDRSGGLPHYRHVDSRLAISAAATGAVLLGIERGLAYRDQRRIKHAKM